MKNTSMLFVVVVATVVSSAPGAAQSSPPSWYLPRNLVAPTVSASVSLDPDGNFRYRYTVANGTTAQQKVNKIFLELAVPAAGAASPTDWYAVIGSKAVSWGSEGTIDPTWVEAHDADVAQYLSEIAPGGSLTGFDLLSPCAGSTAPLTWYVRGYNHFSVQPEGDTSWAAVPAWRDDAIRGTVLGPSDCSTVADWGNRRPGVDGFVGVVNFVNGATLPAGPATIQLRFSRDGETVNRATFTAELNSVDVTAQFRQNSGGDLVGIFSPGSSPAKSGKNVLLLKVEGLKAGTTQTATDADRFTFTLP
jgi:hypothetical protein